MTFSCRASRDGSWAIGNRKAAYEMVRTCTTGLYRTAPTARYQRGLPCFISCYTVLQEKDAMRMTSEHIPQFKLPPRYHERQITPEEFRIMQLGYLNLGTEVEIVGTESGQIFPVTIAAVGRSFEPLQKPRADILITKEEIATSPAWVNANYVTFYAASDQGGSITYDYDRISYSDLGLAPAVDTLGFSMDWYEKPIRYIRWPIAAVCALA
jgi:hypothetical protein